MTLKQLRNVFEDHQDDYSFDYKGKGGSISIFDDEIYLAWNGESTEVKNMDEAMKTPFLDGKSFNEVAEDIILYG